MTNAPATLVSRPRSWLLVAPSEMITGMQDSAMLLALKWRGVRSPLSRWAITGGAGIILLGLLMVINLGYLVKIMALQGSDTAAGVFALSWILSLQRNEIGDVGAITLGGALVVALFAPFTGSSTLALAPVEDLQGMRLSRLHRFFDAVLVNCVSGIGVLQLLALTAVASVLSLDGIRGLALMVTWAVWLSVIVLTTTIGWTLEYGLRRWGIATRWKAGLVIVAGVGVAVALDPNRGRTVFGLGDLYAQMIDAAGSGTFAGFVVPMVSVAVLGGVFAYLGMVMTRLALSRPAVVSGNVMSVRRVRTMPSAPLAIALRMLLDIVWRTPESRRPLLAVVVVGVPGLLIGEFTESLENAVMMAVPLAVALAWSVNVFGLIGGGMTWLAAQPKVLAQVPRAAALLQMLMTIALVEVLWLPAFVLGRASSESGLRLLIAAVVSGAIGAVISLHLSVFKPIRARLSGRGDALVPPVTALGYLFLMLVAVCWPAAAVSGGLPWVRVGAIVVALVVFVVGTTVYENLFARPKVKYRVVAEVSAM